MIFHDTIDLMLGGGEDDDGNPLPTVAVPYRADVWPISAEDRQAFGQTTAVAAYRVVMPPLRAGHKVTTATKIQWDGLEYDVLGPPMVNKVNGRVRHLELLLKRGTG
ncbi:Uncharacterised protein (plasmid) [Tsukamurella tyrosinosolvens]|uniref:Phage head-tail joining protein n=1 Tax=Tsukamurella tyrosinosolvens TaxID=57704 RepID=A0A1H4WND0_TSUTY|nr:head-tail adaptor protein [Tsukamurella tyrosinosolvens]KXO99668.1 hypothetical protein AXK58_00090 [Tsukamurella tyrosinosolvens]SEC94161.1 Phage head-tail joining protein [Tsukamurella tyrosinosolvens]VEH89434.1 Uncharacterised protein [Tsukamurella tyrosinosolvens]